MDKQHLLFVGFEKKAIKRIKSIINEKDLKYDFAPQFSDANEANIIVVNAETKDVCGVVSKIKKHKYSKNIVLYTSIDENLILSCFEAGISDFINKDLSNDIVRAKFRSYIDCKRRTKKSSSKIKIGNLVINTKKRKVTRKGEVVNLTKTEYDILLLLATDNSKIFSRDEIYQYVWGKSIIVGERTLDVHMNNLRKKIGKNKIKTRKGIGFIINNDL